MPDVTFGDQARGVLILNKHSDQLFSSGDRFLPVKGIERKLLLHLKKLELEAKWS